MSRNAATPLSPSHNYRADIDGLRAIAVLAVVIFHAFPSALPGGFTGVDIFFVISGYLITGILTESLYEDRFSIATFYARRIRRIFPALTTVLLATYAIGWISLTGNEYKQLGKHVLAGVAFVSNWALWTEAGYFDQTASSKPLLHLWSLGVEEQFYIVWPLLLGLAFRFRRIGALCLLASIASFAANLLLIQHHASAAFYWPVSRMWELIAGGAISISFSHPAFARRAALWSDILSASGVLLCGASFIALSPNLAFPGIWALLPVTGSGLIIAAGPRGFFNRSLLSQPIAIAIGKLSYAWYLWHWPLLSFAFILAGGTPDGKVRGFLVVTSLILAWLTTALIERPVRLGAPAKWKLVAPCLLMIAVGYLGGMTYERGGLGFRKGYSADADVATAKLGAGDEFVNHTCGVSPDEQKLFHFCATDKRGPVHYAVWGDSKADALYWGLVRLSPADQHWMLIARPSCAPMIGVERVSSNAGDNQQQCRQANEIALQMLLAHPELHTVVLVLAKRDVIGQSFATNGPTAASLSAALLGIDGDITTLQRAGRRVALVLDNPSLRDPRQCMDRKPLAWPIVRHALGMSDTTAAQRCAISYESHVDDMAPYVALVRQLQHRHPDLLVYDPAQVLCDMKHNVCPMTMNGRYLYSYGDHVSDYANGLMAKQFLPMLDNEKARP